MIAFCPTSPFRAAAEVSPLRCPDSAAPLEYTDIPLFDAAAIDATQTGLWRYAAMLPVVAADRERISLGEGWTPLIRDLWDDLPIWWKLDALMPTGSFKDRGVSVMVNWLSGLGITTVVEDSSGNAGASLACYAARARLQARIYVPESAPAPKKSQIAIYGAELVEVPGPRDAATQAAMAASQQDHTVQYASHAWHPAFLLGQMTLAWEIWEQLGRQVPDWFIAPVGQGGALLGAWRGFQHLQASGMTTQLPHLVAVQAEPYTPLLRALSGSIDNMLSSPRPEKISADGIAIRSPVRLESLLAAVRDSHGTAVAVSEEEVQRYRVRLAERGLFVEPTSAVVAAALDQIRSLFRPQETVVAMLTGHGLKNPPHFP